MNNTSCILTVIKNEHEYLDEWIKYHIDLGVDHIFVFEDIGSDSHKEICDAYQSKVSLDNVLTVLSDSDKEKAIELKKTKRWNAQHLYFKNAIKYIKNNYKNLYNWCFIIDSDEFITLESEDDKLSNILSLYQTYDAFIMQWKCYGANGYIQKPDYGDKGLVGTYTKEAEGRVPDSVDSFVKSCYNLAKYSDEFFFNQHYPAEVCNWCNTNYNKDNKVKCYKSIYIRHYITKSWEEYVWKLEKRGFAWGVNRGFNFFFTVNPDMNDSKEKLVKILIENSLARKNKIENKTLVVLPYKQSGSQGNEIRLALNGWIKYCSFKYHFIVIGTFDESLKTEFPSIEFISCPSLPKEEGQFNQHLDVQHCMEFVMKKYGKSYDGFIWMVDDNYAIKPFNLNDIKTIHYHSLSFTGCKGCPKSFWNHDKWKTRQLLDRENLPCINYTTHYPCYFEFSKLKEIWDKYDMRNESYVLEDVYFNYFTHEEPILDKAIRLGIWDRNIYRNEFQKAVENPNIKFICNSVEGWSKELEDDLNKVINN